MTDRAGKTGTSHVPHTLPKLLSQNGNTLVSLSGTSLRTFKVFKGERNKRMGVIIALVDQVLIVRLMLQAMISQSKLSKPGLQAEGYMA